MSKKQSRQNRGARTGGHERRTAAETQAEAEASDVRETEHPIAQQESHKRQRKFGHN